MSSEERGERKAPKKFEDLEVWQKAHQVVLKIYGVTRNYPSDEKFGLTSQMRRAIVSVPANITEGFRKRGIKNKLNFYNIAQASLDELNYYIILSKDLGYIQNNGYLMNHIEEVARMLSGLVKSMRGRNRKLMVYSLFPIFSLLTSHSSFLASHFSLLTSISSNFLTLKEQ